jgi:predicted TPR repeat methyltransferase
LQTFVEKLPPHCLDVALSADTLIYLGDMKRTFEAVANALVPGGLFVATFEKQDEAEGDYRLGVSGRFRHSLAYLKRAAADAGLTVDHVSEEALRTEGGDPVYGYIFACTA